MIVVVKTEEFQCSINQGSEHILSRNRRNLQDCHILEKSLKISGRFPVLYRVRIVKLLSLIISTKN